jgi:Holliday junction resolvasome RuvABC ATP-dependent DNA helicase subunit
MLSVPTLIAQALADWIASEIEESVDFAREGLPDFDIEHFLAQLAANSTIKNQPFSIALVGFGVDDAQLAAQSEARGLSALCGVSTDLHVATEWRNERSDHPRIIALARGYNPSVHGLRFFARASSSELARHLLHWARSQTLFRTTPQHRALIEALETARGLEGLRSLDAIARFLSAWSSHPQGAIDAPRKALPALGLLEDPRLFEGKDLGHALIRNLRMRELVTILAPGEIRQRFDRAERLKSPERRRKLLEALKKVEAFRNDPGSTGLTLEDAETVIKPPSDAPVESPTPPTDPIDDPIEDPIDDPDDSGAPELQSEALDALLVGADEDLESLGEALDEAWTEFEINGERLVAAAQTSKGSVQIDAPVDKKWVDWVLEFCGAHRFGGVVETDVVDLQLALERASDFDPVFIDPDAVWTHNGETRSIETLFAGWDTLVGPQSGQETPFVEIWRTFLVHREKLSKHIPPLIVHPREWLDTHKEARADCDAYLEAAKALYGGIQLHYRTVGSSSPDWAQATLDAILSLDLIQLKITTDGRTSSKAVMLPLHPLHLWRYQRLGSELKGFAATDPLTEEDRAAVIAELKRPEQFLSVVRTGATPEGRGLNQLLPVANDLNGLATFENFHNAVSGADGVQTLVDTIDRYIVLYPNHARPLRIALINPPEPSRLLERLVKLIDERRHLNGGLRLEVNIFATSSHLDRLVSAATLHGKAQDLIYEKIANGRLELRIEDAPATDLDALLDRLSPRSFHLAALFDESSIAIRKRRIERLLRMSPFCVRNEIAFDQLLGTISLTPHPGEPPFSDFVMMINEMEQEQRDSTMYASADANSLRSAVDRMVVSDPAICHWLLIADRALPEEHGMSAVRLLSRPEGRRQVLLAAGDYGRLATLMSSAFESCNLSVDRSTLGEVLRLGANLVGSGLLDMIKKNSGQPDHAKVVGFIGMLLAARRLRRDDPDCLVAAVDSRIARLWLRLGPRHTADRCDLLALRRTPEGRYRLTVIEVKTTKDISIENEDEQVARASQQVTSTAAVVTSAFGDADSFAQPRLEMLKEVFVRSTETRWAEPNADTERRKRWGPLLHELFGDDPVAVTPIVDGEVIVVKLRSADAPRSRQLSVTDTPVTVSTITEGLAEELLAVEDDDACEPPRGPTPSPPSPASTPSRPTAPSQHPAPPEPIEPSTGATHDEPPASPHPPASTTTTKPSDASRAGAEASQVSDLAEAGADESAWPPPLNSLGMIGQSEAVQELVNLARMTRGWNRRYPDKLLVGPAGVGKSSLARLVGIKLLNLEPLLFNGADLRKPEAIVDRLAEQGLVPSRRRGRIEVEPCLIFIDEVHAISPTVATALLSALDDRRTTTVANVVYDFEKVVFLLATTDPGRLSEAFLSRPTRTTLRSYSLNEIAGIIWLHAKSELGEVELSREACIEIGARMQCQPRQSVNKLVPLMARFYATTEQELGREPSPEEVAQRITAASVARWFQEEEGIDANGLGRLHRDFLATLKTRGAASEEDLKRTLGISNKGDFVEVWEYLRRLGLVQTGPGGRSLTQEGRRYLTSGGAMDLRDRISRRLT